MATVVPNPAGEAIQRASENILDFMIAQRRLNLASRRVTDQERRTALETLATIIPTLPEGQTVADLAPFHDLLSVAFPELDPTDVSASGFGSVVLNERNVDDIFEPAIRNRAEQLSENQEFVDRIVSRMTIGTPASGEQLEAGRLQSEILVGALETVTENEDLFRSLAESVARTTLGLDQPVTVRVPDENAPGGVREITWDSTTAAALSVDIWKFMNQGDRLRITARADRAEAKASRIKELRDLFLTQLNKANIAIGPGAASAIIQSSFSDAPADALWDLYNSTEDPMMKAAIQLWGGAASIADNVFLHTMRVTQGGAPIANFIETANGLATNFVPIEKRAGFMEDFTNFLINHGFPIAGYTDPIFGGAELTIPGITPPPGTSPDTVPPDTEPQRGPGVGRGTGTGTGASNLPIGGGQLTEVEIQAALNVLQSGAQSWEELKEELGANADAVKRIAVESGIMTESGRVITGGTGGE